MIHLRKAAIVLLLGGGMGVSHWGTAAHAAGFQLREGDPDWLANAFAGITAKAYDAGTVWNNPAGMTRLGDSEIDTGLTYFDPGIRFSGEDRVGGVPVAGNTGGDAAPPAVGAGFEGYWNASPDVKFGVAAEAPFGLRTAYANGFLGRYQALVSSITDYQLAFAAGWRLTPQLSIGGGPIVTYFHARLTQALNTTTFLPQAGDSILDVHGDATAAGWRISGLYEFSDRFRVGLDYRSRIGIALGGKQTVAIPAAIQNDSPFITGILAALRKPAKTQIALPDVATVGFYYDITPTLAAMGTAQWTHWGLIQTISIEIPGSVEPTPIHFRDTWMGAVGLNWRPIASEPLMLQTGLLYDEGASTDATRGPRLPDEDRIGLGIGAAYALTRAIDLRAAYLHEFPFGSNRTQYSNNFPGAGTLIGSFANNADLVSLGVAIRF